MCQFYLLEGSLIMGGLGIFVHIFANDPFNYLL